MITQAAIASTSPIGRVLDLGCGAGNNTIKLRQELRRDFEVDLLDLSKPMLDRAQQRVRNIGAIEIRTWQVDLREVKLPEPSFNVILAAAVLHHLRENDDWETVFQKPFRLLAPGGSIWITDLVSHEAIGVQNLMWARYGDYLVDLGGEAYRDRVFEYIDKEDSPRPLTYQLELLRRVGFSDVDVLHKHSCFAAFGGIKPRQPAG